MSTPTPDPVAATAAFESTLKAARLAARVEQEPAFQDQTNALRAAMAPAAWEADPHAACTAMLISLHQLGLADVVAGEICGVLDAVAILANPTYGLIPEGWDPSGYLAAIGREV